MGRHLEAAKVQEWISFLETPYSGSMGLAPLEFDSLKNDVLDQLIAQEVIPADLGFRMVQMSSDASLGEVFRDYCIQRLALYYEARWPTGQSNPDSAESLAIRNAYWKAVQGPDAISAGSALIGLERLSRVYGEFERQRLKQTVLSLAQNDATPVQTRITALQLCGVMGDSSALPVARRLSQESKSIPLQLAAIATMGDVGSSVDAVELEQQLARTADPYEKKTIQKALLKLRQAKRETVSNE